MALPQDVQVALQLLPLPGQLGRVGEALGMMQPLRVGLASLIFSGRVRVALKPLMNALPIVAAMQARGTCRLLVHRLPLCGHWQALTSAFNCHGLQGILRWFCEAIVAWLTTATDVPDFSLHLGMPHGGGLQS